VKGLFRRYQPKHRRVPHFTIVDWQAVFDGFGGYAEPVYGLCDCSLDFDHDEDGEPTTPW
jgi:hypothetical protein